MSSDETRAALDRFLTGELIDAGCEETMERLHAYADFILSGGDPEQAYPGIAAHLRACSPCVEDLDGLLAALRELGSS